MRAFVLGLLFLVVLMFALTRLDLSGHQTGSINGKAVSDVKCTNSNKPFALSLATGNPRKPANLVCVDEQTYNRYNIGDYYNG